MGIVATLEYLCELLRSVKKPKRRKQLQTVSLKVRMDCEGCKYKVKKKLSSMKGVKSVEVDLKQQKVTVTGYVEPSRVLRRAESTKKRCEIWPYVPYNSVAYPYVAPSYDRRAPPGYVRRVENTANTATMSTLEEKLATFFSDDNPNACSIM
ncbi:heavy metal-associated isoprenylated plant protein 23-like [Malania oleifera]|uniref:heavy metal-associated isoprenylated plant protein 23-like n=1 Tax=Malania oleifera TaxID=397392 RepID=UPI0025AE78B1|nr:heavy metal-associated isoprenylated plant protein 23-like [Malania oleifera]